MLTPRDSLSHPSVARQCSTAKSCHSPGTSLSKCDLRGVKVDVRSVAFVVLDPDVFDDDEGFQDFGTAGERSFGKAQGASPRLGVFDEIKQGLTADGCARFTEWTTTSSTLTKTSVPESG
jgi:hypothetical protein